MTKDEKLRKIIRDDVSAGFFHELKNQLFQNSRYIRALNAHPDFWPQVIEEMVELQLPYYKTVSDTAIDKAFDFFTSEAGKEWFKLSGQYTLKLNELIPPFVDDLVKRLKAMN